MFKNKVNVKGLCVLTLAMGQKNVEPFESQKNMNSGPFKNKSQKFI